MHGLRLAVGELGLAMLGIGKRIALLGNRHLDQVARLDRARRSRRSCIRPPCASCALDLMRPSPAISRARFRAGVMRGGSPAPAASRTPKRGFTGSNTAGALIIMRSTMPSGASVYLRSTPQSAWTRPGAAARRAARAAP